MNANKKGFMSDTYTGSGSGKSPASTHSGRILETYPVIPDVMTGEVSPDHHGGLAKTPNKAAPDVTGCLTLWDKYGMPPHIRRHCIQVALIVADLARGMEHFGSALCRRTMLAGALLHDIAKIYTIRHGGAHSQLGAAQMLRETGNYTLAQMIYHHVSWPWNIDVDNSLTLPSLLLIYADKRVRHDKVVTLEERRLDLLERYGFTEQSRLYINESMRQAAAIEMALSQRLGVTLNECAFAGRRLVA